jgi:hypothetical protein
MRSCLLPQARAELTCLLAAPELFQLFSDHVITFFTCARASPFLLTPTHELVARRGAKSGAQASVPQYPSAHTYNPATMQRINTARVWALIIAMMASTCSAKDSSTVRHSCHRDLSVAHRRRCAESPGREDSPRAVCAVRWAVVRKTTPPAPQAPRPPMPTRH